MQPGKRTPGGISFRRSSHDIEIRLPPRPDLIAAIKSIEGWWWHPEHALWTVPDTEASIARLRWLFGPALIDSELRIPANPGITVDNDATAIGETTDPEAVRQPTKDGAGPPDGIGSETRAQLDALDRAMAYCPCVSKPQGGAP